MRRRIWFIATSLLIGFLLTIANAWGFEFARAMGWVGGASVQADAEWPMVVPSDWPSKPFDASEVSFLGYTSVTAFCSPADGWVGTATERRMGWPMHSMYLHRHSVAELGTFARNTSGPLPAKPSLPELTLAYGWDFRFNRESQPGYGVGAYSYKVARLPFSIRPVGFVGNWLLFSLIVAAATYLGWRFLPPGRAAVRRNKGLCGGCGYAIADLAVCPECGAGVSGRRGSDGLEARSTEGAERLP